VPFLLCHRISIDLASHRHQLYNVIIQRLGQLWASESAAASQYGAKARDGRRARPTFCKAARRTRPEGRLRARLSAVERVSRRETGAQGTRSVRRRRRVQAGVCVDGKNVTPPPHDKRRTAGRWEKSPSQPCPSVCGGKPLVLLTVCLRKRRWPVWRRPARSKRPICRRGHCFWTLFAEVWDGETRSSVVARSIVRPFWRARGNDVTAGTASVRLSVSVALPRRYQRLCPPATPSHRACRGG